MAELGPLAWVSNKAALSGWARNRDRLLGENPLPTSLHVVVGGN